MKSIKWVTVMFLVAAGLAGAAQTFTDTYNLGQTGSRGPGSNHLIGITPFPVNHALNGFTRGHTIVDAALSIEGLSANHVCWRFEQNRLPQPNDDYNGLIGQKQGILMEHPYRFHLQPYQAMIQSMSDASTGSSLKRHTIGGGSGFYSLNDDNGPQPRIPTLDPVGPLSPFKDPMMIPPSTVPAPSAVVLGSIGIILVGWLRKRANAS